MKNPMARVPTEKSIEALRWASQGNKFYRQYKPEREGGYEMPNPGQIKAGKTRRRIEEILEAQQLRKILGE